MRAAVGVDSSCHGFRAAGRWPPSSGGER
jgi:hypothetical protein